jgi:hypothetical protein
MHDASLPFLLEAHGLKVHGSKGRGGIVSHDRNAATLLQ